MASYKIIKSGHIIEIYEYEKTRMPLNILSLQDEDEYENEIDREEEEEEDSDPIDRGDRKDEYRQRTNIRARNNLRRLINANFDNTSLFVTMTFAENITDIPFANTEFKKFIQRMKYKQKDFQYTAVIEFQKRGAIHYHMICNWKCDPWETTEELHDRENVIAKIWRHGFCDIKKIKHLDNVGAYLIKYMSKNNIDERLEGKRRYFYSQNLVTPVELTGEEALKVIEAHKKMIPVFSNQYTSEWTGVVKYREFNHLRQGEILE